MTHSISRGWIRMVVAFVGSTALVLSACKGGERAAPPDEAVRRFVPAALTVVPGSDAHAAHEAQNIDCAVCHECGGYAFASGYALPSGTSIAGGQMIRDASGTTCLVACHSPLTTTLTPVPWNAVGPIACVSCHAAQGSASGAMSLHATDASTPEANRQACQGCHDVSAHMSGTVRVKDADGAPVDLGGDGSQVNGLCLSCHDGSGQVLAGKTPPVVVGWESATGDWHGTRAGPLFGTVLAPPYQTPAAPMACIACHDAHASPNRFLLAAAPNGLALPPGAIARNGVGAEALCRACHLGARHSACSQTGCHATDPAPAGSACFFCHGHEGLQNISFSFSPPTTSTWKCDHCHYAVPVPTPDLLPPILSPGSLAVQVSATSATIKWITNEGATSYVEWGLVAPGTTTGNYTLATQHAVTLAGLDELTTYTFRVRSADAQRNVVQSALATFTTPSIHAPSQPVLVIRGSTSTYATSVNVTLSWKASTAEAGHAVQYRAIVSHTADFAQLVADSGWLSTTSFTRSLPVGEDAASALYYWRVVARDEVNGFESPWSAPSQFSLRMRGD
jgi:predicted CXXCH cytochrome family protein